MNNEWLFRVNETWRFTKALVASQPGRHFLWQHLLNTLLIAGLLTLSFFIVMFGFYEGTPMRRRSVAISFSLLLTFLIIYPLATMPFFSFKDLVNKISLRLAGRRVFTNLSDHVFYSQDSGGQITLHLAKAHHVLAQKHAYLRQQLIKGKTDSAQVSKHLSLALAKSIRDAVRLSKELVKSGRLNPQQTITGATYGYLFGTAKSKLKLRRVEPGLVKRWLGHWFYKFGALHAVYTYFIIHQQLPPSFDPVYFQATVGDVIGIH